MPFCVTASTAELAARFVRARTEARPNGRPPDHAVPFTLVAVATAYGLLFLPTGQVDYGKASVAGVLGVALLGLALCWSRFPRVAAIGIPLGYIALAALLREAAGGSQSGFGGLFLLPVLWLAVTAGRRELAAIIAAMAVAQAVPLAFAGAPEYPASGWRGAVVLCTVAAITGLMVQRLVDDARRRNTLLEEHTESLSRASAQLARQNERLLELDRLKDLRIVQRNADRLTVLVDQLLFLARVDSHRLEVDRHPVDLGEILTEAAETAGPAARAKNIALLLDTESPRRVLADRPQLLRLVDNLVVNAIKFTPEGGTVGLAATGDGATATLAVTDTGVGITSADRPELFKRFFRGTSAIEKAIPGSGLGLAISQVIAEAHGTTIEVESIAGAGSTFSLAFPAA